MKKTLLISTILMTSLTYGCGKKEVQSDGPDPVTQEEIISVVDKSFPKGKKSDFEADDFKSLLEDNAEVSWSKVEEKSGVYTFTDLKFENLDDEERQLNIDTLTLVNPRMVGDDGFYVSALTFENLSAVEDGSLEVGTVKKVKAVFPDGSKVNNFIDSLVDMDGPDEDVAKSMAELSETLKDYSGGGYVMDYAFNTGEEQVEFGFMGWSIDSKKSRGDMLISDFNMLQNDPMPDEPTSMKLDKFALSGMDMNKVSTAFENGIGGLMGLYIYAFDPFSYFTESVVLEGMDVQDEEIVVSVPAMKMWMAGSGKNNKTAYVSGEFNVSPNLEDPNFVDPDILELLKILETDKLGFKYNSQAELDYKNDIYNLEKAELSLDNGFNLKVSHEMSGVKNMFGQMQKSFIDYMPGWDFEAMENSEMFGPAMGMSMMGAINELTLNELEMTYVDNDFLEKMIAVQAKEQDVTPAVIRQQMKSEAMMMTLGAETEYQKKLTRQMAESFQALIEDGGSITLSLNPEGGFEFGNIMGYAMMGGGDPDRLIKQLDIKVTHSR